MSPMLVCAQDQWRYWCRSGLSVGALGLFALLTISSVMVTLLRMDNERSTRAKHQAAAQAAFQAQPNRHPHRMVHYGHYVFRAPPPLAYFDPGLDRVTGQGLFLEGHKQNTATFSPSAASAPLGRFSWLTPAQIYQTLAPLVLILLGHSLLAREREGQTLAPLLAQGVSRATLLGGKLLALFSAAALLLAPLLISLAAARQQGEHSLVLFALGGAYVLYLGFWCLCIALAASLLAQRASVLLALIVLWIGLTILAPVLAVDATKAALAAPGKLATDLELALTQSTGDGHSISSQAMEQLKTQALERYQVSRVEELPVNLRGLVAQQAEEQLTHSLNQAAKQYMDAEAQQTQMLTRLGWLAPALSVGAASRALAATDLAHFHAFLTGAEQVRYDFVQALNQLHATQLRYEDDKNRSSDADAERRTRISADHWRLLPEYRPQPAPATQRIARASSALGQLLLWWLLLAAGIGLSVRRLRV